MNGRLLDVILLTHQSLPHDQLEITALSYGKGPRESISPPTQDEQETMANIWAMEEVNSPSGWENEQEIDYAELASKRMAAETRGMDKSRDSGRCAEPEVCN